MLSHSTCQKRHALRRFAQHYSLAVSDRDYAAMCEWIRHNDWAGNSQRALFLCRRYQRFSHWVIQCCGHWIPVVYDESTENIVTVLSPEALTKPRYQEAVRKYNLPPQRAVAGLCPFGKLLVDALQGFTPAH